MNCVGNAIISGSQNKDVNSSGRHFLIRRIMQMVTQVIRVISKFELAVEVSESVPGHRCND